jgi:N-acetylglucosamine-6-phosphate deacetylase
MRAVDLKEGIYDLGGQKVIVTKGQVRLKDETLAGSVLTVEKQLKI